MTQCFGDSVLTAGAVNGSTGLDEILIGLHYGDVSLNEGRDQRDHPRNIWPYFDDYAKFLADEMALTSYADFWRWWFILERYKGDETGLEQLDTIVDRCLDLGLKVKIDPAWSTWWTLDRDWEKGFKLTVGPQNLDDWIHFCDLLGRRYRGRVALWDLQGEANDLKNYWQGQPIDHVQEVYRLGYQVLKQRDPLCRVGASGATPSFSRKDLEWWYGANIAACAGFYDSIAINYFADVADPYHGGLNYYRAVRDKLDTAGQQHVEVGMGETSVQWAETTQDAATGKLNQQLQAVRLNEMFGQLFTAGMNKFIFWGTEFAPGGGHWPWRWGLRNYEDWWGIWPQRFKVPGTQIVCLLEGKDGAQVDLRQVWARPADPFYPAWEVFRFWAQLAPAGVEARALTVSTADDAVWTKAAYQHARDQVIVLAHAQQRGKPLTLSINLSATGWSAETPLDIAIAGDAIDMRTGEHAEGCRDRREASWKGTPLQLNIPEASHFTTVIITPAPPAVRAVLEGAVFPETVPVGQTAEGYLVLRNEGAREWSCRQLRLAIYDALRTPAEPNVVWPLPHDIAAGASAAIRFEAPASDAPGRAWYGLRLHDGTGWVGPVFGVACRVVDPEAPRKVVAHRQLGHVRLQWFAPRRGRAKGYEILRAAGFNQPFQMLATVSGDQLEYIDTPEELDKAYYYQVRAIDDAGRRSRPGNEDNAAALSAPRIMDAEIVAHDVPAQVRVGDVHMVKITVRNTGSKTWDLDRPAQVRYRLQPTRLWGRTNEAQLPAMELTGPARVEPGQQVILECPFVGPKPGVYENHWIMYMEVPGNRQDFSAGWQSEIGYAYFGTPLLVETNVTETWKRALEPITRGIPCHDSDAPPNGTMEPGQLSGD